MNKDSEALDPDRLLAKIEAHLEDIAKSLRTIASNFQAIAVHGLKVTK